MLWRIDRIESVGRDNAVKLLIGKWQGHVQVTLGLIHVRDAFLGLRQHFGAEVNSAQRCTRMVLP